jgi:hypothetical protein
LYVYALLGGRIARTRLPRRRMEVISVAGLFAATERLRQPPQVTETALRRQHRIVVALSRLSRAVLPVRFGTFMSEADLEHIVKTRRSVLLRALEQVRDHQQMTVRIFGPPLPAARVGRSSTGSEYLRARAAAARPALTPPALALIAAVSPVVDAAIVSGSRGGVQLTLDHLVHRSRVTRYRRLLSACADALEPRPSIAVSGPWPPFAFAPDVWTMAREAEEG